jgi:hypothetical protein
MTELKNQEIEVDVSELSSLNNEDILIKLIGLSYLIEEEGVFSSETEQTIKNSIKVLEDELSRRES